jgi:hypothetical protein
MLARAANADRPQTRLARLLALLGLDHFVHIGISRRGTRVRARRLEIAIRRRWVGAVGT